MSPVFLRHVRRDNLSLSLFLLFTSARPSVPALPAGRLLLPVSETSLDRKQRRTEFIFLSSSWYFIFRPSFLFQGGPVRFCEMVAAYQHLHYGASFWVHSRQHTQEERRWRPYSLILSFENEHHHSQNPVISNYSAHLSPCVDVFFTMPNRCKVVKRSIYSLTTDGIFSTVFPWLLR